MVLALLLVGCGAASASTEVASSGGMRAGNEVDANGAPVAGRGTADDPVQLCHMNGGLGRTDYAYVASYRCPDGTVPLMRDPERGARARRGNVGAGPDGHVIDLYDVPCASGAVEVYVDAYHCGADVDTEIDPNDLTRSQLASFAAVIRALHDDPSSERALDARRQLLLWLVDSPQVTVTVCGGVLELLPENPSHPYASELLLSMAASVIEDGRDAADPVAATFRELQGMLLYYTAVLRAEGDTARNPELDSLLAMARDDALEPRVREIVAGCDLSGMGVHHAR